MAGEYGGYLPLELNIGYEYFSPKYDMKIRRYNSARSAIVMAAIDFSGMGGYVYLPVYLCDSVFYALKRAYKKLNSII